MRILNRSSASLRLSLLAVLCAAVGCATRPERYPGTDVLAIPGLEVESATNLQQSGSSLQSGTLVFRGEGNLREIFREYLKAMEHEGWLTTFSDFTGDSGTATLRKDNRVAKLAFSNGKRKITASLQVCPAVPVEPDSRKELR